MDLPGQGHLFSTDDPRGAYGQPTEGRPIITARDPTVTAEEAPRLSRQCLAILDRLREGPATNRELATISLKYTGRLSEVRRYLHFHGDDVVVVRRDYRSGLTLYALKSQTEG